MTARPWIDLRDAHVASYILSVAERGGHSISSFAESVNSLENSTVRNQEGRITKLKLDYNIQDETASLASEIEQLEQLKRLELWGCKQLPKEIGNLAFMTSLKLIRCFGLQNLPSTPNMKRLSHLSINSLPRDDFSSLVNQIGQLPSLEILSLNYVSLRSSDIVALLLQKDNAFQRTLIELNLYGNEIDQQGLATLLDDVLPKFPRLARVDLGRNQISSLTDCTSTDHYHHGRHTQPPHAPSCLQKLQIKYNPIWYNADPQNQKALLQILQWHPQLGWLGDSFEDTSLLYNPVILHQLDLNRCGRVLIDGNRFGMGVADSVWPAVLERANNVMSTSTTKHQERQSRSANAIFYLISNGGAFADCSHDRQKHHCLGEDTRVMKRPRL